MSTTHNTTFLKNLRSTGTAFKLVGNQKKLLDYLSATNKCTIPLKHIWLVDLPQTCNLLSLVNHDLNKQESMKKFLRYFTKPFAKLNSSFLSATSLPQGQFQVTDEETASLIRRSSLFLYYLQP